MRRIVIRETDGLTGETTVAGHFDLDRATVLDAETYWNGSDRADVNTRSPHHHQRLIRTAQGRWVLERWSNYANTDDTHEYVDEPTARDWLLVNGYNSEADAYFGEQPEERGPGRPEIGSTFQVRLPPQLRADLEHHALPDESLAATIRRLLEVAVKVEATGPRCTHEGRHNYVDGRCTLAPAT